MNLSEIRAALAQARVKPVKTLGQNFLHDQNLARWIVDQTRITSDDFVLEIGPGLGALTEEILRRGARLLALEKDARLVSFLRDKFRDARCEIVHCDALEFDTRALFAKHNVKLLGNLPYYIASQLLIRFTDYPTCIQLALLMLQDEMARRVAAQSGDSEYGNLSLRIQLHYHVDYLRKIPAPVFFPKPDVASAIVRLTPRPEKEANVFDFEVFRELVRAGFSQRRKQLRNLIGARVDEWESVAAEIGFPTMARAEQLSLQQWTALSNRTARAGTKSAAQDVEERFPIVDAQDRKIGEAPRAKVHENNWRHRAVHILIFNGEGEVLLQKRSAWKDRHPLLWDSSAAGHLDANEEYDSAATRELKEELGIFTKLSRVGKLEASDKTGQEFIWVYRGQHNGPFQLPREEISTVKFFPPAIVDEWIANKPGDFAPGFRECWRL